MGRGNVKLSSPSSCSPKEIPASQPLFLAALKWTMDGLRVLEGKFGKETHRYCEILPSAVPRGERELGLECENSTINLITRAVAPAPVSGVFWWDGTS